MNATNLSKEDGYKRYYLPLAILAVIVFWGVVPAFAQLGGLPGPVTTFYVNWIALAAVALIITFTKGGWAKFRNYSPKQYATMIGIGVVWPLLYSVAYFSSVDNVGAAWTTILNYSWPIWYFLFALFLVRGKLARFNKVRLAIAIVLIVSAVSFVVIAGGSAGLVLGPALALGLIAGLTQGFYSAANDRWDYDPWVMTFVVEAVTAIGVTPLVLLTNTLVMPTLSTWFYLAIIGALANGVGFWAFLYGSKLSDRVNKKAMWLVAVCFVPFGQMLVSLISGISVPWYYWIGAAVAVVALVFAKFADPANTKN